MAKSKTIIKSNNKNHLESGLEGLLVSKSEVKKIIEQLDPQHGKNALPITEIRKMLDRELGEKTLTGELLKMREES